MSSFKKLASYHGSLLSEVIGPKLRLVLSLVFLLFLLLAVNGLYLLIVRVMEWLTGDLYQNYFYQYMFLFHLLAGIAIAVLVIAFGISHLRLSWGHPNRYAFRLGISLFGAALVLIASGVVLTRIEGLIDVRNPHVRSTSYWLHVLSPFAVGVLFLLHRKAGRPIQWAVGVRLTSLAVVFAMLMVALHIQDPRRWNAKAPESGRIYFEPSLAKTSTGKFIPAYKLTADDYCRECHQDAHENWNYSAHHLSSFNNPAYLASVREARRVVAERDGTTHASRFCAGCHDPVPFFSGAFDDEKFDDPDYDLAGDVSAQAGVTCTTCHAITSIDSTRGNADYTIEEPIHYPFAFSENDFLKWVSNALVRANPDMHKKTFLKPLHKTAEFCGSCHKVHLPEELNAYRFLRGQNHYDAFLLSGVSGHGVASFYHPQLAEENCNNCHMPLHESADFGARFFDASGKLKIHDHQFPSANTALATFVDAPEWVNKKHRDFNQGVMRVDIFAVRDGGTIDGELVAPVGPEMPRLQPGEKYLVDVVVRTLKMGHLFTQGTVDSNEVWLDVKVTQGGRLIGRSGGMDPLGNVDPWSHFVNAFVIDREGNRINRRNAQDIFVPLYNHQIPPGAAQVVHYLVDVPADSREPVKMEVSLRYRKFDAEYFRYYKDDPTAVNDLPIMTLATDEVEFVTDEATEPRSIPEGEFPLWQRWNDYGIALLNEGSEGSNRGELRQAERAFAIVQDLERPDGPLNRARVYIKEGRLEEAAGALKQASSFDPPANPWTLLWLTGLVNMQFGELDEAIENFQSVIELDTAETRARKLDFSADYTLLNQLASALFERSKQERGTARRENRDAYLRQAAEIYRRTLSLDSENVAAHYNLSLIYRLLGDEEASQEHADLHAKYKVDDNARDQAIVRARARYPYADHAAESIVIWDLQREGAFELPESPIHQQKVSKVND